MIIKIVNISWEYSVMLTMWLGKLSTEPQTLTYECLKYLQSLNRFKYYLPSLL